MRKLISNIWFKILAILISVGMMISIILTISLWNKPKEDKYYSLHITDTLLFVPLWGDGYQAVVNYDLSFVLEYDNNLWYEFEDILYDNMTVVSDLDNFVVNPDLNEQELFFSKLAPSDWVLSSGGFILGTYGKGFEKGSHLWYPVFSIHNKHSKTGDLVNINSGMTRVHHTPVNYSSEKQNIVIEDRYDRW